MQAGVRKYPDKWETASSGLSLKEVVATSLLKMCNETRQVTK